MLLFDGNSVYEVTEANIFQMLREEKKLFKTEVVHTERYGIEFYYKGDRVTTLRCNYTKTQAQAILLKLYNDGKLDLTELGYTPSGSSARVY